MEECVLQGQFATMDEFERCTKCSVVFHTYETYLPPAVSGNGFVGRSKAKMLCTLLQHMKLIFSLMALEVHYEFSFLLSEHA